MALGSQAFGFQSAMLQNAHKADVHLWVGTVRGPACIVKPPANPTPQTSADHQTTLRPCVLGATDTTPTIAGHH